MLRLKKNMRRWILAHLRDGIISSADLLYAFLKSGYGASMWKIEREFSSLQRQRLTSRASEAPKQRYYNIIYKLKKDRLLAESKIGGRKFFALTGTGKNRLKEAENRPRRALPLINYESKKSNTYTIIIFDIPEVDKWKRQWLRTSLKYIGMSLLQKSVWMGKIKVPRNFLADLEELEIVQYVQLFEVTKMGSL